MAIAGPLTAIGSAVISELPPLSVVPIYEILLAVTVVVSVVVLSRLDGGMEPVSALRSRFLYGVPWGTLVSMAIVIGVYLFIQGGISDRYEPTVIPFRAWSYFDPGAVLISGFAHANYGHLRGNMIGTLALAPLAEYAFGHYATTKSDAAGVFGRPASTAIGDVRSWLWTDPRARAFLVFPAGVVAVGILTGIFSLGPAIGFSGVVYAFAGFALVYYPIATIVALSARGVLSGLYNAFSTPVQISTAQPGYNTPWFAGIAVQGHAIGLFFGVACALALLWYRSDTPPSASRLWIGALLYGISQSLWAIYWYRGGEEYVLYRAIGLALVFVLATVIAAAATAPDRPLLPARAVTAPNTIRESIASATGRQAAALVVVVAIALLVGPTIPVSLTTADDAALPGDPIEIDGYEITYGEDVPDGLVGVVDVEAFGETTQVNTSGVIVRNTDKHVWTTATTAGRLGFEGRSTVRVGGIGWQETVVATREGWVATNGGTTYRITLSHDNTTRTAYRADPVTAEPIVAGSRLSIVTEAAEFVVVATPARTAVNETETNETSEMNVTNESNERNHSVTPTERIDSDEAIRTAIPAAGENTSLGNFTIHNVEGRLFVEHERTDTIVRIADKERYGEDRRVR